MGSKITFYRNSDFKTNKYFKRPEFKLRLQEASKHGKDVLHNEIRKLNNCRYARTLQGDISIKDIFYLYWNQFKDKYKKRLTRSNLINSIETMISCHNFDNGYLYYECPNCKNFYMIGFSCNSRFCQSCGQKYKKQRTIKVSEKCLNVPHRQFVFTIPYQLREYFQRYRGLLDILFKSANETLNSCLQHHAPIKYKQEKRRLGFISFLHTFGRDLKWHPHLHILIAERYVTCNGKIKKYDYFPFNYLRITFQNILFHNIYNYFKFVIKDYNLTRKIYRLCLDLKKLYPNGYYIYGPKFNDYYTSSKDIKLLTNYIARYASHPPISERRILKLDTSNNTITWFYDPHEDDDIMDEEFKKGRQIITEDVFDFIARLIIHIPNKGFQQIRYYGFYSNKFLNKIKYINLFSNAELSKMSNNVYWVNALKVSFGYDPTHCTCGNQMLLIYELSSYP